jgi:L-lysine 6-transaminase
MQVHDTLKKYTIGDGHEMVLDLIASRGSWVVDKITKKKYLDLGSQYASMAVGWNHPGISYRFPFQVVSNKIANPDCYTESYAAFVEEISSVTPDFDHYFFIEGGSAAVENALKAAFDWKAQKLNLTEEEANKLDVIHLKQAFHGRGGYALSLTNTVAQKTALFPKFNWTRINNPRLKFPVVEPEATRETVEALNQAEQALKTKQVAAIILETIQGEGGDHHFSKEFLLGLRSLADQYEALLIFDEIQCGMGITGKYWAYQHYNVYPDLMCFGKKTQTCGFCSTTRIDSVPSNVFHVSSRICSTWGGNLVDMSRFVLISKIIKEENLVENAKQMGNYLLEKLNLLPVQNVRGKGLMIAFDLETSEKRDATLKKLREKCLVLPCGEISIRLRPHLNLNMADANTALNYIEEAIQ